MGAQVPFIEGTPLEIQYVADSEGVAIRSVPTEKFVAELEADPQVAPRSPVLLPTTSPATTEAKLACPALCRDWAGANAA